MFRAALYARVSTNDQQTLPMQIRAMREYAARRGWTHRHADQGGRLRRVATRGCAKNCSMLRAAARSMSCWCGGWIAGAGR